MPNFPNYQLPSVDLTPVAFCCECCEDHGPYHGSGVGNICWTELSNQDCEGFVDAGQGFYG